MITKVYKKTAWLNAEVQKEKITSFTKSLTEPRVHVSYLALSCLTVCITGIFLILQNSVNNLGARVEELSISQAATANNLALADQSYTSQIKILDRDLYILQNKVNSQESIINAQAEEISGYEQRFTDMNNEVKAFENAVLVAAPKIELESTWSGPVLNSYDGVCYGPSGRETYYNLPMSGVINNMRKLGFSEEEYPYWVRDDGVKMFGKYVMVAANLKIRPYGTIIETSLGWGIVVDTGTFVETYPEGLDIAVNW